MNQIHVLDQNTIDKIAAGEVVERPAAVIKELTENAIDAGANRITIEIRDGGISMMRITDNGKGIAEEDIPLAFLRHATSKINDAKDLASLVSLGFRGEALSSISAVSRVEMITKQRDDLTAVRYVIEGGREKLKEEIGAPDGTTLVIRDLFYNTPARAKFLKTPMTEASHVGDYVEQLILSNPDISFTFLMNGQRKLASSGNGRLKDAIFQIYGKDLVSELLEVNVEEEGIRIEGYIGKPSISRGNRNFENYYVNGRYVKSKIVSRGIEDGYQNKLMNHQYPFTCLKITVDATAVDVNVHPTKMDVRFSDERRIYEAMRKAVRETLENQEMILRSSFNPPEKKSAPEKAERPPEVFETKAMASTGITNEAPKPVSEPVAIPQRAPVKPFIPTSPKSMDSSDEGLSSMGINTSKPKESFYQEKLRGDLMTDSSYKGSAMVRDEVKPNAKPKEEGQFVQQTFEPEFLSKEAKPMRRIIGQVFNTYWICEFDGNMYIFDQHAAHERCLFEKLMKQYSDREITSQQLSPPMIVTCDSRESELLTTYADAFAGLGFEIENFGEQDFAIRAVPYTLGGIDSADLFRQFLDQLEVTANVSDMNVYIRKIATEACKAAVKGGEQLDTQEAQNLLDELMSCENPYHCPHGRPTIISFTRSDLEKRFKRIL